MAKAMLTKENGDPIKIDYADVKKMVPFEVQTKKGSPGQGGGQPGHLGTAIYLNDGRRIVVQEPEGAVTDAFRIAPQANEEAWKPNPNYDPDAGGGTAVADDEVDADLDFGDDDED